VPRTLVAAVALSLIVAGSALAQEYGRTDAGDLQLFAKGAKPISGSISFGQGTLGSKLFNASAGGTLVADRIWFFASAAKVDNVLTNRFGNTALPAAPARAADAKMTAQLGDRQSLVAALSTDRSTLTNAVLPQARLSATDFSMHYTGIVSPSAFFNVSVSQHRSAVTQP
jgi:hypothetical protein